MVTTLFHLLMSFLALCMLCVSVASADSAPAERNGILAEVGSVAITRRELDAEYVTQLGSGPIGFILKHRDRLARHLLQQMIDRKLLLGEADRTSLATRPAGGDAARLDESAVDRAIRLKRGIGRRGERLDRVLRIFHLTEEDLRGPLRERLLVERFLNEALASSSLASDAEMTQELIDHPERYRQVEERRVRQIFIPIHAVHSVEEVAQLEHFAVQIKLLSATTDFVLLAKRYATETSRAKGGDLGWITENQFEPAFANTVFRLPLMVVSEPFRTADGINIVRVDEQRGGEIPREETLRGRLSAAVIARKREHALKELLTAARLTRRVIVYFK